MLGSGIQFAVPINQPGSGSVLLGGGGPNGVPVSSQQQVATSSAGPVIIRQQPFTILPQGAMVVASSASR
jgi:hypothetical protein